MNEVYQNIVERRSIRKYQSKQVSKADMEKVIEAGLYAPNAGGRQSTWIIGIRDAELVDKIGRMNRVHFGRNRPGFVSKEQPSIIDDPTIASAFYGAPAVCAVFAPENFLYSIADSFCCAENMVLMAKGLGLASCIIARGEDTFEGEAGENLLREWGVPEGYIARCFVILGYCDGEYPAVKPRKDGRSKIIG